MVRASIMIHDGDEVLARALVSIGFTTTTGAFLHGATPAAALSLHNIFDES